MGENELGSRPQAAIQGTDYDAPGALFPCSRRFGTTARSAVFPTRLGIAYRLRSTREQAIARKSDGKRLKPSQLKFSMIMAGSRRKAASANQTLLYVKPSPCGPIKSSNGNANTIWSLEWT